MNKKYTIHLKYNDEIKTTVSGRRKLPLGQASLFSLKITDYIM